MEKIINEWDQMVEADVLEKLVKKVARIEIVEAMQKLKSSDHLK